MCINACRAVQMAHQRSNFNVGTSVGGLWYILPLMFCKWFKNNRHHCQLFITFIVLYVTQKHILFQSLCQSIQPRIHCSWLFWIDAPHNVTQMTLLHRWNYLYHRYVWVIPEINNLGLK